MRSLIALTLLAIPLAAVAQTAHFAVQGRVQSIAAPDAAPVARDIAEVTEIFGTLADGRLVVGLGAEDAGENVTPARTLAIVDGEQTTVIADRVLRAYPAPVGEAIAMITPERDSLLFDGAEVIDLGIERRASQFAWFPDGRSIAMTCFDPDWSPHLQSNADSYEEFLRMNNNDIWRLDLDSMAFTPLVVHPEADWCPVISPDGTQMIFASTRVNSRADLCRLDLATGEITPLNPTERVPVPLVNQAIWRGDQLVYATTRDNNFPEIRVVQTDGTGSALIDEGSHPQLIAGGAAVAFLSASGEIATARLGGGE
ncbi:PD40 domain-containing protein [Candidatus Sumerlaeota bacterium]|nr:PD40 domain-containing protein [Candidatus Sumerlaeota bacterium]